MTYGEEPVKILAREVKQLRNKSIALVKVLWNRHGVDEATWEPEDSIQIFSQVRFSRMKIPKGGRNVTS